VARQYLHVTKGIRQCSELRATATKRRRSCNVFTKHDQFIVQSWMRVNFPSADTDQPLRTSSRPRTQRLPQRLGMRHYVVVQRGEHHVTQLRPASHRLHCLHPIHQVRRTNQSKPDVRHQRHGMLVDSRVCPQPIPRNLVKNIDQLQLVTHSL